MTQKGLQTVLDAARKVQSTAPEILQPVAEFFNVDVGERLENKKHWKALAYAEY
jgi:hypothetical protein